MKRIALLGVLLVLVIPFFPVGAQQPTATSTPQFSVEPTAPVPVVPVSDNTSIFVVVISVASLLIFGIVVRPAVVSAGANLPPAAVELFMAPISAALKLAADSAAKTPSTFDDVAVNELKEMVSGLLVEIKAKQGTPTP
jgi:hypothetical protein